MTWRFHPDAAGDYLDVCRHYATIDTSLALAFAAAFEAAVDDVTTYPKAWPTVEEDIQRRLLKRFPFGLYYTLEEDHVLVLAVQHVRRKPQSFQERARWRA